MNASSRPFLAGLGLLLGGLPLLPAASPPAPAAGSKPYVLFMGADLAVQREKKYYRVEDVTGSEFKIRVGRKEFFVPTRNRATNLQVNNSLKLTGARVQVDGLEAGPAYTPANDPMRKFIAASGAAGGAAAVRDLAYGQMIQTEIALAASGNALANTPEGSASRGMVEAAYKNATDAYAQSGQMAVRGNEYVMSQEFDTTAYADKMARERAEGNFDAMDVSFKVSSPVELTDAYMVVLFKFQEREAKPGESSLLIHAKALEAIGPKPKYIRVREGGLPRGFKYLDCEVHLYHRGQEIATNVSPKQVELTRAEAQQYLVIQHLGTHKGASLPAAGVPGTLPLPARQRLSIDQLNRTLYARVGADGALLGAYADESCAVHVDDTGVLAALGEVFFNPALVNGKPVEGTARLRLAEL